MQSTADCAALLDYLSEACTLAAAAVLQQPAQGELHFRLGMLIEEQGHIRELYEKTVVNDADVTFDSADTDWQQQPAAEADAKILALL